MAQHKVSLSIEHPIDVGNVDVVFVVRQGTKLLGRAKISKGGVDWQKAGAHGATKVTWAQFAEWMES